jgi:hypothetical protein
MNTPSPTLLGYRARRPAAPLPDSPTIITHIASLCDCITIPIAPGRGEPEWDHVNMAFHYPSPHAARHAAVRLGQAVDPSVTLETLDPTIEIHATRLYPWICYARGDIDTVTIGFSLNNSRGELAQPLPANATRLGHEVIALLESPRSQRRTTLNHISFGCAPLSCNHEAKNYPINRWCLLDNIEDARRAMQTFAAEEPEPGPYMIAEVWRCTE